MTGCIAPSIPLSHPGHQIIKRGAEMERGVTSHHTFDILQKQDSSPIMVNFSTVVQNRPPLRPSALISVMLGVLGVSLLPPEIWCFSLLFFRQGKAFPRKKNKIKFWSPRPSLLEWKLGESWHCCCGGSVSFLYKGTSLTFQCQTKTEEGIYPAFISLFHLL